MSIIDDLKDIESPGHKLLVAIHEFRQANQDLYGPSYLELREQTGVPMFNIYANVRVLYALGLIDCAMRNGKVIGRSLRVTEKGRQLLDAQ